MSATYEFSSPPARLTVGRRVFVSTTKTEVLLIAATWPFKVKWALPGGSCASATLEERFVETAGCFGCPRSSWATLHLRRRLRDPRGGC